MSADVNESLPDSGELPAAETRTNGKKEAHSTVVSEIERMDADYRSTRRRINRSRQTCLLLTLLAMIFFTLAVRWVVLNPTAGKTYFLNTAFSLTVVSLACTVMLLIGLGSLLCWFYLTRIRIRLENNRANLDLHLLFGLQHIEREQAALARELREHITISDERLRKLADNRLEEAGKLKNAFLSRCDQLHRSMDEALRLLSFNIDSNDEYQ